MTSLQEAKPNSAKTKWRPREQVTAMVIAACVSLGYVLGASYLFALPLPTSAFWWLFGISTVAAIAFAWWGKWWDASLAFILKAGYEGGDSDPLSDPPPASTHSDRRTKLEYNIGRVAAVLYACSMITHLGWVTVFTGGCFYSPFSQLLIGCALLAPYVANGVRSGIGMVALSLLSYAIFGYVVGFWLPSDPIPNHLVFLTTVLATLISLVTINLRGIAKWHRSRGAVRQGVAS